MTKGEEKQSASRRKFSTKVPSRIGIGNFPVHLFEFLRFTGIQVQRAAKSARHSIHVHFLQVWRYESTTVRVRVHSCADGCAKRAPGLAQLFRLDWFHEVIHSVESKR